MKRAAIKRYTKLTIQKLLGYLRRYIIMRRKHGEAEKN